MGPMLQVPGAGPLHVACGALDAEACSQELARGGRPPDQNALLEDRECSS